MPAPPTAHRPTRLIVDCTAIESNAHIMCHRISPGTRLMAVVKANGYGHGSIEVARAALRGGASALGVATVLEGIELRMAGIGAPVLVLGPSAPAEAATAAENSISIGVGDLQQAIRLLDALSGSPPSRPLAVQLKIDTGMRRFGVQPVDAASVARELASHPLLQLEGVYSHFAEADSTTTERMEQQVNLFRSVLESIRAAGIDPGIAHISNSGSLLRKRDCDFGMVRAGICLYGIPPSEHVALFDGMNAALEWRATVQHIVTTEPGDRVGYGGTYVTSEQERIALLPIGYADGYSRQLSNRGWVGFQGQSLPIRGRISMDQCAVGLPAGLELRVGDEVAVIGGIGSGAPNANELGATIGTIGYEVVSRISRRVPVEYRQARGLSVI